MRKELSLVGGKLVPTLLRFTLPFMAASLLQFCYGAADLMIVGQFANTAGVSAVSTGSEVMQTITNLVMGLATGGTVLIGQYLGARRRVEVGRTIGTMFTLFSILAVGLTVVCALSTNLIVEAMHVPAQAVAPARQYLFICSCGILFITGYNMVSAMLRGMGDSKRPMLFVLVSCVLNILGDLLLVGVFHLGASGAALATVASQAVSLLLSIRVLSRRDFPFDFRRGSFKLYRDKVSKLLRLGTPVALQNVLVSLSFLIITAIVNHLGLSQSAAVGTVERVITFCMMAPSAFSAAISAMAAQNMGAGKVQRAKSSLGYGILFSLLFGVLMFLLIQTWAEWAVSLFSRDAQVIYHGALYVRSYSIDCILVSLVFCLNGFFSGCGRTTFTMVNCLAATFLVRVPVVLLMSMIPGVTLYQIGLAAPAASLLQIVIQLLYYRSGRWSHSILETPPNILEVDP